MENRVIKFRAYNPTTKQMLYSHEAPEANLMQLGYFFLGVGMSEETIAMQFTGLLDKNGVEIYEGDIVRLIGGTCDYLPCGIYSNQIHPIGTELIVAKLDTGYTLQPRSIFGKYSTPNLVGNVNNYDFWNHQKSLAVIGNIYEEK